MILRIPILSPANSGAPDYTIDGQASTLVAWANLEAVLTVNGTSVISVADLSAFGFGTGLNIACAGGVTVEDIVNESLGGGSVLKLKITFPTTNPLNIHQYAEVGLILNKTNYISYTESFRIYDIDLGNNADVAITDNPDFNIYLISTVDNVVSNQQTKPFSKGITISEPFTRTVYFYNAVSNGVEWGGSIEYINDVDEVVLSANGVLNTEGNPIITLKNTLPNGESASVSLVYWNNQFKHLPTLSHNAQVPVSSSETVDVYTDLSFINTSDVVYRNDNPIGSAFKKGTLYYELIDVYGKVHSTHSVSFSASGSPTTFSYSKTAGSNYFSFSVPATGTFTVRVTFSAVTEEDGGGNEINQYQYVDELTIAGTFAFELKKNECKIYNVKNSYTSAFVVTLYQLTSVRTWTAISSNTLDSGDDVAISIPEDGVYKFETEFGNTTYAYIIASFCNIEECIKDFVNDVLVDNSKAACCNDCEDAAKEKTIFNLNMIILSLDVYTQLMSTYGLSFIFENSNNIVLEDLWSISQIGERLTTYCQDCDCDCK